VFFVISGLVIAHASERPGLTLTEYSILRFARIESVAIPAIILSAAVALLVHGLGLENLVSGATDISVVASQIGLNLLFLGQIWGLDINPPLNSLFWSLNFEVWYYALFGAWTFLRGRRRAISLAVILLIAGQKILLLLPIWITGVLLYRHLPRWNATMSVATFLVTAAIAIIMLRFDVSVAVRTEMLAAWPEMMGGLGGANEFAGDTIFGLVVACNFAAAANLGRYAAVLYKFEHAIRRAAGCTFSAYMYHLPLIVLFHSVFGLSDIAALGAVVLAVVALARVTEQQLPTVRRWTEGVASLCCLPESRRWRSTASNTHYGSR
jgi:peptidoglycan/LPS O-acetylase OafA/YrhL